MSVEGRSSRGRSEAPNRQSDKSCAKPKLSSSCTNTGGGLPPCHQHSKVESFNSSQQARMSSVKVARVSPTVSRAKVLPTQFQSKPLIRRSTSDSSKNLSALFLTVVEEITSADHQYRFTIHATPHFKKNHLGSLLRRRNHSVPTVEELILSVLRLSWDDEKKAAFLEAILRDMKYDELADELAEFRKDLTGEYMASASVDIQIDSKRVPNMSDDRRQAVLMKAFRFTSQHIGNKGSLLLRCLGLPDSFIADYEGQNVSIEVKCNNGLTTWMQSRGENATLDCLMAALGDVDRQDIIDEISRFGCQSDGSSSCQPFGSHQTSFGFSSKLPVRVVVTPQRLGSGTKEETSLSPQQVAESSSLRHSKSAVKFSVVAARQLKKANASSQKIASNTTDQETTHNRECSTPAGASQIPVRVDRDGSTSPPQQPTPPVYPREAKRLFRESEGIPTGHRKEDFAIDMSGLDEQLSPRRKMLKVTSSDEFPERNRHIQIIAVGQTGVGKTTSINNVLGTISTSSTRLSSSGKVGGPRGNSTTDEIVTYTRQLRDRGLLQLSFTDTPGFGDSTCTISDDQICNALKKAVIDKAEVIILYFAKADEQQHSLHIKSIQKIQEALKRDISGVVCTRAATKPVFATTWEDHAPEIKKNWSNGKLRNIFLEEMVSKGKHADEKSFRDFENSSSWDASSKKLILKLFCRQERHHEKMKWLQRELNRPKLPVLLLENSQANDRSGRFSIKKFHQRLTGMLSVFSQITFDLLTSEETIEDEELLRLVVEKVSCRDGTLTHSFSMKHPKDTSSPKTKLERKESHMSFWKRLIEWIKSFLSKKKEDNTCQ